MAVGARRHAQADPALELRCGKIHVGFIDSRRNRIVGTVSNPTASLWSASILDDRVAEDADVKPFGLPTAQSSAPRFGANSLFYLSSLGAGDGVWRFDDPQSIEI